MFKAGDWVVCTSITTYSKNAFYAKCYKYEVCKDHDNDSLYIIDDENTKNYQIQNCPSMFKLYKEPTMSTTSKQEAQQQLEKLQAEMDKLKEIINKPEKAGSLLEDGEYRICGSHSEGLIASNYGFGVNSFKDLKLARDYAEAFMTMLELRKCEGSEAVVHGVSQYCIEPKPMLSELYIESWNTSQQKVSLISPSFSKKEHAQAAIIKVGEDKIFKMFKTLHGL